MPRRNDERELTNALEFTTSTPRSLINGKDAADPKVIESAIWARDALNEFLDQNCGEDCKARACSRIRELLAA